MTPEAFVEKWKRSRLKEEAAAQSHFNDLCDLLDVPRPTTADPDGTWYTFEKQVQKVAGGKGFADVWRRDAFAWEYKGRGKNLKDAYVQLLAYREDLGNPPLLIVSDTERIEIHTNFTGTQKNIEVFRLDDLLDGKKRARLRDAWILPAVFDPSAVRADVTQAVVDDLLVVADALKAQMDPGGQPLHAPDAVAHFLVRVVFTFFAQSAGLLPRSSFTQLLDAALDHPDDFQPMATQLFDMMALGGVSIVGRVPHFNGSVFDRGPVPVLTLGAVQVLRNAARRDWTALEPSMFGTLFERVIVTEKRAQLGAFYTSPSDILDVVLPVIIEPLRREWTAIRAQLTPFLEEQSHKEPPETGLFTERRQDSDLTSGASAVLEAFRARLAAVTVLDPAMGSGNFLYVTMRALLDLENEVRAVQQLVQPELRTEPLVHPRQFLGLEINEYAHEIASMVLWIGYLQWLREHGEPLAHEPVLERLPGLERRNAVIDELTGAPAAWPDAEFIVGNPPFLGEKRQRDTLPAGEVDRLRAAYAGRVPGTADLVAYWFERAREQVETGRTRRVGLIATKSIRQPGNREVLRRIKETGDHFLAWPNRSWTQDGASVRVSIVGFDDGSEQRKTVRHFEDEHGPRETWQMVVQDVEVIHEDLSAGADLTSAERLGENLGQAFQGVKLVGPFDLTGEEAGELLLLPNPTGRDNADVVKLFVNGDDMTGVSSGRWVIDFGLMSREDAAQYQVPFSLVETKVQPLRANNNRKAYRDRWWQFAENRPAMRRALAPLARCLVTSEVAKHRTFVWLDTGVVPAGSLVVIATDDDFMFGVLNSTAHTFWAQRTGQRMGVANDLRYTPTTCFDTFPFPRPSAAQREAVTAAARHLASVRSHLKGRRLTLTAMYNALAADHLPIEIQALDAAHSALDAAVAASYGWSEPLETEAFLIKLLDLNLERSDQKPASADLPERVVESIRQSMRVEGIQVSGNDVREAAVSVLAKPAGS